MVLTYISRDNDFGSTWDLINLEGEVIEKDFDSTGDMTMWANDNGHVFLPLYLKKNHTLLGMGGGNLTLEQQIKNGYPVIEIPVSEDFNPEKHYRLIILLRGDLYVKSFSYETITKIGRRWNYKAMHEFGGFDSDYKPELSYNGLLKYFDLIVSYYGIWD